MGTWRTTAQPARHAGAKRSRRSGARGGGKTPSLYLWILAVWGGLLGALVPVVTTSVGHAVGRDARGLTIVLLAGNGLFVAYFWLNGVKDLVYVVYFYLNRRSLLLPVASSAPSAGQPRVVLLYCTANDFSGESLERSLCQDYWNSRLVILDDSTDAAMRARVDAFALRHGGEVVRRADRVGFKAGNLNNYLAGREDYDYFVLLDSDEIIPIDFIPRALDYFAARDDVGIVQANHEATRNRTRFMRLFARGVDSHWPTYQAVKDHAGFMSLLGHGAMVSRRCYEAAGGFPHVVAEDLCFSIEARSAGYLTVFAPDVVCAEEYPVDYLAFKKRHSKWTQGNLEFIRAYTGRIARSPMRWFEKLDIVLFTYNLPLTAFFALYIVLNVIALPLLGYMPHYPAWLLVPTLVFLLAPMANDIVFYWRRSSRLELGWYLVNTFVLYGSMFFVSLYASLRGMLGVKATFVVTPKETERVGLLSAVRHNHRELAFAAAILAVATFTTGTPLPVLLIALPSILSIYLTLLTAPRSRRARHVQRGRLPLVTFEELVAAVPAS
jgi:cellulose synthase/poly-beta-1,6-N-acetylglucosamine synthase-like glycosyltransferase